MEITTTTVAQLIHKYDGLALDAFGVLVDESGAKEGAVQLLNHLNAVKKPYWIVTNGNSRDAGEMASYYGSLGLQVDGARVITSGCLLPGFFRAENLVGAKVAVMGTKSSQRMVQAAGGVPVDPLSRRDFDVLLVSNQTEFPFLETIDAVISAVIERRDRGQPVRLVLTNPDLVYPKGRGTYGITSGSIALIIENVLNLRFPGNSDNIFDRLGKPYPPIFKELCARAGSHNLVMIGDQLDTDIKGARSFGLDAALYTKGITSPAALATLDEWLPNYILDDLWDGGATV